MQGKCIYVSTRTTDSCSGWERVFRAAPPHRAAVPPCRRQGAAAGRSPAGQTDRRTAGLGPRHTDPAERLGAR